MLDVRIKKFHRLEKEVVAYEKQEIQKRKILFYGDSGFTRWNTPFGNRPMEEDLLGKDGSVAVVNHGFGGSTAEEQLYYYNRMILPWEPKVLVNMTHGNDWDAGYTATEIMFLQSRLFEYARRDIPGIHIYACDVRPSVKNREGGSHLRAHELEYNELLANYCSKHDDCTLVSHWDNPLFFVDPNRLGEYDNIREDIFIEYKIHYNQVGYDLYRDFFREVLKDEL
jgi:hypothetical protein